MWDQLRDELEYRPVLRKYFDDCAESRDAVTDHSRADCGRDLEQTKKQEAQQQEIGVIMTIHLVYKARRYYLPVPTGDGSWLYSEYYSRKYLTREAARKLYLEIRAEQRARWHYFGKAA
jgi:hypothetical protein